MSLKDRLKESCNNLAYNADSAWLDSSDLYQKTNLQLYLMKKHLDENVSKSNRPRTVKDCIPNSRLAQYSNYEYNESREMSYTPSNSSPIFSYNTSTPTEPWEIPEVEYLFRWFSFNDSQNFSKSNIHFESPFLNVKGLEERILKERISQNKIKEIWKKDELQQNGTMTQTNNLPIQACSSHLKNEINNESTYKDLEKLTQSICQQSNSVQKRTNPYQKNTNCENSTNTSTSLLLLQQSLYFYRRPVYWSSNWTNRLFERNYKDFSRDKDTSVKIPQYDQLTATDSEELEIQALEQYQGSNDNIPSTT